MFSGHGAVIDGQFYLLPYGVDLRTLGTLKETAIAARDLQSQFADLAKHGQVLVLLDACRSGAITDEGDQFGPNADLLRQAVVASNVTVLTSSQANEISREDPQWSNGAFTKIFLEALGRAADTDSNGLISRSELTNYLKNELPKLTEKLAASRT